MTRKRIERPEYLYENLEILPRQLKERGSTQREVEEAAGIPHQSLTRWICGENYPSKENYNKLAAYLGWRLWQ